MLRGETVCSKIGLWEGYKTCCPSIRKQLSSREHTVEKLHNEDELIVAWYTASGNIKWGAMASV